MNNAKFLRTPFFREAGKQPPVAFQKKVEAVFSVQRTFRSS